MKFDMFICYLANVTLFLKKKSKIEIDSYSEKDFI